MKKGSLFLYSILGLLLTYSSIFTSCKPVYYQPNMQNVLVLKEKNDVAIGAFPSLNLNSDFSKNYAYNFQGAYAFTKNLGVGFNADAIKSTNGKDGGKGNITELGICYFKELTPGISFNNYLWLGLGSLENHFYRQTGTDTIPTLKNIEAKFTRFAIQPSISFKQGAIGLVIAGRLSQLSYNNINDHLGIVSGNIVSEGYLNSHKNSYMLEPSVTLKLGKEHLNFFIQYVLSMNLTYSDFPMEKKSFGVGLSYNFNFAKKSPLK